MNKTFNYFLFDWDGCLADSLPVWLDSYKAAFPVYNLKFTERQIIDEIFYKWEVLVEHGITDFDEFGDRIYTYLNENYYSIKLHQDSSDAVKALHSQGKKIGIVTSSGKDVFLKTLNHHRFEKYFETLVAREDVENYKPHPEPLLKAMNDIKAKKEETIMIGDSLVDILGGKNVGVATAWYYPKANEKFYPPDYVKEANPDFIIRDMNELLKFT